MKIKKSEILRCPVCGAEYLAAEIYVPNAFFGKPSFIQRDADNRIIDYFGSPMCPTEHYCCDYCDSKFKVYAKTQFFTQLEVEIDKDKE